MKDLQGGDEYEGAGRAGRIAMFSFDSAIDMSVIHFDQV
jgi:hypothetical protein